MSSGIPTIETVVARADWDDHRFMGRSVFRELAGNASVTDLMALAVTGRRLPSESLAVLDDIAVVLTFADPRIWPLKLSRLIASYGRAMPAVAAGCVVLDRAQIGAYPCRMAAEVLAKFHTAFGHSIDDASEVERQVKAHLDEHRFLWGFGVPYREHDERLVSLRECMARRGDRQTLPHWQTMEAVAAAARRLRNAEPNIGAGIAAACLDIGVTAEEVGGLSAILLEHTFVANAVEGARQRNEVLLRLPEGCVTYVGTAPRLSPKASGELRSTPPPGPTYLSLSFGSKLSPE